jgi:hypothetical protein
LAETPEEKALREALKREAVKKIPKTDPKALDRIRDRTKGK